MDKKIITNTLVLFVECRILKRIQIKYKILRIRRGKIRIKATGKVYDLGNREQAVEACCSSYSGYVTTNSDYEAAKKAVEYYREGGYDDDILQMKHD